MLVTKNVKLSAIKEMVVSRIPGEPRTFHSADSVENNYLQAKFSAEIRYAQKLLNQVDARSPMPDHCWTLKKGYDLMVRNLRPKKGHANCVRYVIEGITDNELFLRSVFGAFKGEYLAFPQVKGLPGDQGFTIAEFIRRQFRV